MTCNSSVILNKKELYCNDPAEGPGDNTMFRNKSNVIAIASFTYRNQLPRIHHRSQDSLQATDHRNNPRGYTSVQDMLVVQEDR